MRHPWESDGKDIPVRLLHTITITFAQADLETFHVLNTIHFNLGLILHTSLLDVRAICCSWHWDKRGRTVLIAVLEQDKISEEIAIPVLYSGTVREYSHCIVIAIPYLCTYVCSIIGTQVCLSHRSPIDISSHSIWCGRAIFGPRLWTGTACLERPYSERFSL